MADEEQFSLCWNNFNSNLSAGFHESLCRGDLVDVTLAAEGQLVKAHRLVLSVCSPYFRKMFTQMPANQHAFVFLKDVSHAALKDLIQFMYCGEVNVKQDALPTFISTAEALQIKGLTETGEPATPASSQTPVKVSTPAPSVASTTATTSPRSRVQRNISRTSYKLESEDSSDDKPAPVVAQKRLISRSITPVTAPALKRTKNSDPLEASEPTSQQQIITTIETKSNAEETEFIDLPMETMPTKSEPDYGDDTGEVEAVDQDTTYVEDDSGDYGDMKYDSSYFTENDDVKAGASGFAEPYAETGDQSANEAQVLNKIRAKTQKAKSEICHVPLHTGSTVYVSKNDLMKIYTDKPDVYIKRLADLIFGTEIRQPTGRKRNNLDDLDAVRLKSFIVHVLKLFETKVNQELVTAILTKHISSVQNNAKIMKKVLKDKAK
ncbi:modifier of mdg4 isoform X8 [Bradysia coprophila]|uniref:modifier of mdg4 isoform X8 n=1 Tax=Bradysia coprophila TaxID=38358 RepID=UPI00187D9039|nr:modifier of mdg4 isoform X8 [Bradysia coprophila]